MSFKRCYLLASMTRPVTTNLMTRFVSRNTRLQRCFSKDADKSQDNIKIAETSILSKIDNKSSDARINLINDANAITSVVQKHQQSVTTSPDEDFIDDSDITLPKALDTCTENLSDIGPYLTPTFTFAKYANKSHTIRELVKLGVSLYKFEEKQDMVKFILSRDFDRDIKPYIRFLHDCGVPADYLGTFLTKNPYILKEDLDDLHTRIRYLRAHEFNANMIKIIVCKNPKWLLYTTKDIDGRLGYFQTNFKLNGQEVRWVTVKAPKVITYRMQHLTSNTLTIKEDMDFNPIQTKKLLLKLPRIWTKNRKRLLDTFDYAHDEMQLQRDFIVKLPYILLCRKTRLQQRHSFLVKLERAQYDPTKPMYISPKDLVSGTDIDFCKNIAKTSIEIYDAYLKTL